MSEDLPGWMGSAAAAADAVTDAAAAAAAVVDAAAAAVVAVLALCCFDIVAAIADAFQRSNRFAVPICSIINIWCKHE